MIDTAAERAKRPFNPWLTAADRYLDEIDRLNADFDEVVASNDQHGNEIVRLKDENEKLVEELDACRNGLANARAALRKTPEPPRDT